MVEAGGVELSGVLITRKLLIPGMAATAKKAPLPDPLYVHCTKLFCTGIPQTSHRGHRSAHLTQFSYGRISRPIRP